MPKLEPIIDVLDNVGDSIIINDYSGGLNTTESNELLKNNEAIVRQNWGQESLGAIKKVNGFTKINSTKIADAPIRGLFRVYLSNGTKQLLAMCNGGLYYSDDDGENFTQESGVVSFSTSQFNHGVNYNNLFFFTNTTNNLYHYTVGTTTAAAATDTPTYPCKILLKRADRRLLALINSTYGATLFYSKIDPTGTSGTDWSATNDAGSIAIDGALSEPLTGGMTFGSYDLIFKQYACFKVWGYPAPQAVRMPGSPGCIAPYSPAQGDGLGFHLAHDGIYMYDGNKFIKISDPIKSLIDTIRANYKINAFGVYRDGLYRLFYTKSGDTVNKSCLIYDVFHSNPYEGRNIWYQRKGLEMNCPIVFDGETDDNELYAGGSASTGFVYELDYSSTGADNTSNIKAIYQTKYFNGGTPHLVKAYRKLHIRYYSAGGELLINWYTNRGNTTGNFIIAASQTGTALGSFILDTSTLAGMVENEHTERLPDTAIGKDISIKITHDDKGVPPIIRDMTIDYDALYAI